MYFLLQSGSLNMERLTLRNVTLSDAGWYTCVLNNIYGQVQHSAWIEVLNEESLNGTILYYNYYFVFLAMTITVGVFAAIAAIVSIVRCWQRHRPPKSRALVLRENSVYFQPLDLPIDPQWEINRIQ